MVKPIHAAYIIRTEAFISKLNYSNLHQTGKTGCAAAANDSQATMLDFIPLLFVFGNYNRSKPLGQTRMCPNCGAKEGAELYEVRPWSFPSC